MRMLFEECSSSVLSEGHDDRCAVVTCDKDVRRLDRVVVVRPGGNDTALVFDRIPRREQVALSNQIQAAYPAIEQVMFVEKGPFGAVHGQMAGGEFCGNATRSLGFVLSGGKNGRIFFEVSNGDEPVRAEVAIAGKNAQTSVPVRPRFDMISLNVQTGEYIVDMPGIVFLVTTPDRETGRRISAIDSIKEKKRLVREILRESGLDQRPASGLLVMQGLGDNACKLDPFVLVRETGSLYYESACGSASTALGIISALETGASVRNLEIQQPSGMSLYVTIDRNDKGFLGAFVDGPVEILSDGPMILSDHQKRSVLKWGLG